MPELLAASIETLFAFIDEVFLKIRAKRYLSRVSNYETAILFVPRKRHATSRNRGDRMNAIARMESLGWIYIGDKAMQGKASGNGLVGETLQFIREVTA